MTPLWPFCWPFARFAAHDAQPAGARVVGTGAAIGSWAGSGRSQLPIATIRLSPSQSSGRFMAAPSVSVRTSCARDHAFHRYAAPAARTVGARLEGNRPEAGETVPIVTAGGAGRGA